MSWQNNGDYYNFKQDSIIKHAPTGSGVYSLFNFRHQIVIGSAANVRDALLHHRRHTNFRFSRFEPSGFTFELCPAERRESRAEELIKEYQPISSAQTPIGIATLYRSWRIPNARAFRAEDVSHKKSTRPKVVAIATKPRKTQRNAPLPLNVERFGLAGALCGLVFLTVGLIGLIPYIKNMFEVVVRNSTANAESRRYVQVEKIQLARTQDVGAAESAGNTSGTVSPITIEQLTSDTARNEANIDAPTEARSATAQAASPAPVASAKPEPELKQHTAKREVPASGWSVQIMATTDKQFANDWLQKLKAKGYEAYLVEANINGNTWHRVRIGTFRSRQDADNLRAELKAKESYRDAFVVGYDAPPATIALNS
jgi:cell division septation protein DedD